jgi:hypothetical protein
VSYTRSSSSSSSSSSGRVAMDFCDVELSNDWTTSSSTTTTVLEKNDDHLSKARILVYAGAGSPNCASHVQFGKNIYGGLMINGGATITPQTLVRTTFPSTIELFVKNDELVEVLNDFREWS